MSSNLLRGHGVVDPHLRGPGRSLPEPSSHLLYQIQLDISSEAFFVKSNLPGDSNMINLFQII